MTTHTRRKRSAGFGLAVFALAAGAVGYLAGRIERRENAAPAGAQEGFDVDRLEVPRAQIAVRGPGSGALEESSPAAARFAPAAAPAARPAATAAPAKGTQTSGERRAKSDAGFGSLLDKPAEFMLKRSYLGKPASFRKFAGDPRKVRAWLNGPVVSAVTNSPSLVRLLALRPGVMRALLASPAMQDPASINALAPLAKELAQRPGVRAALEDQALVKRTLMGPEVMSWLAKHPEGTAAFSQLSGSFAAPSAPRRR